MGFGHLLAYSDHKEATLFRGNFSTVEEANHCRREREITVIIAIALRSNGKAAVDVAREEDYSIRSFGSSFLTQAFLKSQ